MSNLQGLMMFAAYFVSSLVLLALFARLYLLTTPYDDMNEIKKGNIAPAIAFAGAMLGFTFPLVVASYLHSAFVEFIVWGIISCLIQLAVFNAFHRVLPRMIEANNAAVALCFAIAAVCAGLINAASFVP